MIIFLKKFLTMSAPDALFLPLINAYNTINGRGAVVTRLDGEDIYAVEQGGRKAHTSRRSRLRRYFFGIDKQCEALSREYLLHNITFNKGDIVIDCGANNGEIGMWAQSNGLDYYAFEPEPLESRCCDLNNFNGSRKTVRKGLWNEEKVLKWFSKPESADSSLIEIEDTENVVSIETTTLEKFVTENKINHIRLFKLEAEGAEPEVLQGALGALDKIDYIAADCGYERGKDKKHTFMEVYKTLNAHNFEIVAAEFRRVVFLFKRRDAME